MKLITNIIKFFTPRASNLQLGRWKIGESDKIINYKADLANDDHCGPCGNNILREKPIFIPILIPKDKNQ